MSNSYNNSQQNGRNAEGYRDGGRGGFRGGRGPGGREAGGFQIRLSDNEMNAARSIQEAFNLRSTVAVLGFAIRTLAQMIEEGKLDELISQYREQGARGNNRTNQNGNSNYINSDRKANQKNRDPKPNPFARPSKPENPPEDVKDQNISEEKGESKSEFSSNDSTPEKNLAIEDSGSSKEE